MPVIGAGANSASICFTVGKLPSSSGGNCSTSFVSINHLCAPALAFLTSEDHAADVRTGRETRCKATSTFGFDRQPDWLNRATVRISTYMHSIRIPHFDDLAIASGRSPAELERELRLLLAIKLFELKRVSMGQAADIAGLSRFAFLDELAKLGVAAIDFDPEEAEQEFGNV